MLIWDNGGAMTPKKTVKKYAPKPGSSKQPSSEAVDFLIKEYELAI